MMLQLLPALLQRIDAAATLGDKGYDSDAIIERIERAGTLAIIPARSHRKVSRYPIRSLYTERNVAHAFLQSPQTQSRPSYPLRKDGRELHRNDSPNLCKDVGTLKTRPKLMRANHTNLYNFVFIVGNVPSCGHGSASDTLPGRKPDDPVSLGG